jgi:hypothetical protein
MLYTSSSTPTPLPRAFRKSRIWPRRQRLVRVLILPEGSFDDEPREAWLIDSSPGGLRLTLLLDNTIVEGSTLHVKAATAEAAAAWTRVQVRNRRCKNGRAELGCQCVGLALSGTGRVAEMPAEER